MYFKARHGLCVFLNMLNWIFHNPVNYATDPCVKSVGLIRPKAGLILVIQETPGPMTQIQKTLCAIAHTQ